MPGRDDRVVSGLSAVGKSLAVVDLSSPNVPGYQALVGVRGIGHGEVMLRSGLLHVAGHGVVGHVSSVVGPRHVVGDTGPPVVVRHEGDVALFGGTTIVDGEQLVDDVTTRLPESVSRLPARPPRLPPVPAVLRHSASGSSWDPRSSWAGGPASQPQKRTSAQGAAMPGMVVRR